MVIIFINKTQVPEIPQEPKKSEFVPEKFTLRLSTKSLIASSESSETSKSLETPKPLKITLSRPKTTTSHFKKPRDSMSSFVQSPTPPRQDTGMEILTSSGRPARRARLIRKPLYNDYEMMEVQQEDHQAPTKRRASILPAEEEMVFF